MRRILAGVVLALMLTGGAVQEPFQEAFVAWSKGDYASAFRLWRPLAAQGDAASQFYLATLYEQGRGVPQDYAEGTASLPNKVMAGRKAVWAGFTRRDSKSR